MGEGFEPFQRKRQMRTALVIGDGVDFVHDYGFNVAQNGPALFSGQAECKAIPE